MWEEDRCLHRKAVSAPNLAILRNTLLAVIPEDNEHGSLAAILEHYRDHKSQAIALRDSTRLT